MSVRRDGNLLEICHYPSGVRATGTFIPTGQSEHYIDVRVYVPKSHMGQTRAFFGNFDGNSNNDWSQRDGTPGPMGPRPNGQQLITTMETCKSCTLLH